MANVATTDRKKLLYTNVEKLYNLRVPQAAAA
jgi:hypothetical protein